jgi:hypothetical protein
MRLSLPPVVSIAVLLFAAGHAAASPRFICYTVQSGDTASRMALRLTGEVKNLHEAWFQILDPVAARFIPKTDYKHIQPGWQACVQQGDAVYAPRPIDSQAIRAAGMVDGLGWWWLTFLCAGSLLTWIVAQSYADRRKATVRALEYYGTAFLREFERPLRQASARTAVGAMRSESRVHSTGRTDVLRSQLSILPQRARVDILVAPADGHRYPNLSDHRRNVEYDVQRVMERLGDWRFVCGELVVRGPWVVIPFRFEPRLARRPRGVAPGATQGGDA